MQTDHAVPIFEPQRVAETYVALWNEPDPGIRRTSIRALWTPAGTRYVRSRECHGYDAIESRVAEAFEKNVRQGGYRFRAAKSAQTLRNVLTFKWEMTCAGEDAVEADGRVFLILDANGRIVADYQFIES